MSSPFSSVYYILVIYKYYKTSYLNEFQRLCDNKHRRANLPLRWVAQQSKWQRCPKHKIYVDRKDGCTFIA